MENRHRTALLIDTDNVSTDVVAQVFELLEQRGHLLQHRRAYGSVQKANEFAEFSKDHAIRFLPSTFAGPNATDLALAIDAVELMLREPVDEVVLVSSDRDYAPLVVRLRELGCRVTGFGQQGKSASDIGRDYLRVYDGFEVITPRKAAAVAKARPAPKPAAAAPAAAAAKPARQAAAKSQPAAKQRAVPKYQVLPEPPPLSRQQLVPLPAAGPLPEVVEQVLQACPELRQGETLHLSVIGKKLHDSGVLKKSGRPSALLKKHEAHFEMLPASKPETVRFRG